MVGQLKAWVLAKLVSPPANLNPHPRDKLSSSAPASSLKVPQPEIGRASFAQPLGPRQQPRRGTSAFGIWWQHGPWTWTQTPAATGLGLWTTHVRLPTLKSPVQPLFTVFQPFGFSLSPIKPTYTAHHCSSWGEWAMRLAGL